MKETLPKIVVVVGPTASGKSDLAVVLARTFGGEIISADSRQVYRGLNLGTGKVNKREMKGVPHHLLDVADAKRVYSVARFQRDARRAIVQIQKKGNLPIVVGGTGFYVDALVRDMRLPKVKPDMKLRKKLEKVSTDTLFEQLREMDPRRAESIDAKNRVRLIRALEIATLDGPATPLAAVSSYDVLWIGISTESDLLKARIALRIKKRIKLGMITEFKHLHADGLSYRRMEALGLEYRYGARLLQGQLSRQEFESELGRATTRYAKRQMTWFKRSKEIHWLPRGDDKKATALVNDFLKKGFS